MRTPVLYRLTLLTSALGLLLPFSALAYLDPLQGLYGDQAYQPVSEPTQSDTLYDRPTQRTGADRVRAQQELSAERRANEQLQAWQAEPEAEPRHAAPEEPRPPRTATSEPVLLSTTSTSSEEEDTDQAFLNFLNALEEGNSVNRAAAPSEGSTYQTQAAADRRAERIAAQLQNAHSGAPIYDIRDQTDGKGKGKGKGPVPVQPTRTSTLAGTGLESVVVLLLGAGAALYVLRRARRDSVRTAA